MTAASARTPSCPDCPAAAAQAGHHDALLRVDRDPDQLLALMEMAVTWHELDWSAADVIGPEHWPTFARRHSWVYPERAETAFLLAGDILAHSARRPAGPTWAKVIDLVRG
jgi:hypothetical protein